MDSREDGAKNLPPVSLMRVFLAAAIFAASASAAVDFNRDIRPIFSDRCYTCHGPDQSKRMSKLRLDSETGAASAIVPGKPEQSLLIQRLRSADPARRMPPQAMGHAALSDADIGKIEQWVLEGARWQSHWSLVPPRRAAEPSVQRRAWVVNPIDAFILKRLESEGLNPSPEADRATLIRRAALDLTGLPPTLRDLDAFLNDRSTNAYEKA